MSYSLQNITAQNMQGATFSHALKPITFFVGGNYSGKSTRLNAVRLLLGGYLPELGKLPRATFDLSSGRVMAVVGVLTPKPSGEKLAISRKFHLDGDSIRQSEDVSQTFGDASLLLVMLNVDEWIGLSERDRVEWVAKNVGAATSMTRAEIITSLRSSVRDDDEDFDVPMVDEFFSDLEKRLRAMEDEVGPQADADFLTILLEALTLVQKEARDHAKTMDKTAAGLATLRAADELGENLPAIATKIGALEKEAEEIRERKAKAETDLNGQKGNALRRHRLTMEIAGKATATIHRDKISAEVERVRSALAALPPDLPELPDLKRTERDERQALGAFEVDFRNADESLRQNLVDLNDLEGRTVCPFCGATGTGWKEKRRGDLQSSQEGTTAKRAEIARNLGELKVSVGRLCSRIGAAEQTRDERGRLLNELSRRQDQLRVADAEVAGFAGKDAELASIPAADPGIEAAFDMAKSELTVKLAARDELAVKRDGVIGRKEEIKRLAQAESNRDRAKIDEKIAKTAAEAVRALRSKLVEETMRPVVEAANRMFGHLMESPIAYDGARAQIGRWSGGIWIGHKTFSGVEKLIAYAAIQAALASKSKVRVMIMDEMLRAKNTRKRMMFDELVSACKAAVRGGDLDNFVGVIPGDPEEYPGLASAEEADCVLIPVE